MTTILRSSGAALAAALVTAMPMSSANAVVCLPYKVTAVAFGPGQSATRAIARAEWSAYVTVRWGSRYANWVLARNTSQPCSGWAFYECKAIGQPCRADIVFRRR